MIGKKSKFEEHERNSKVPDKKSSNKSSSDKKIGGIGENAEIDKRLSSKDESVRVTYRDIPFGIPPDEDESESYLNIAPEALSIEEQSKEIKAKAKSNETQFSKNNGEIQQSVSIINLKNLKTDTDLLWDEIVNGVKGKNSGIPMGFNRLNKYLGLRKSIYTTIGAAAGCGKTSLVDCAYVLNPYDWYIKNKDKATTNVKFEVIYFSMERKKTYKLAKWLCMKIWKEENILLTTDELLSWQNTLDKKKQEIAKFYIDNYFKEMTESGIVTIIDGQLNPTGVYKFMKANALKKGKEIEISEFENRYIPDNDNLITNVVHDHAGKTKNENIGGKYDKKLSIDKASEYYCWARDYLGYSPIMINQFNRTAYQDIQFSKKEGGDPDPTVEYWKDSGNVIEDCDVAISLFNPYKYSLEEYMKYNINDFTDSLGNNKFRGLKIIKNSYGTDNLRIGLGFLGEVSLFKELTKSDTISQKEINSVINNDFFWGS
jgi:hypothetical protein